MTIDQLFLLKEEMLKDLDPWNEEAIEAILDFYSKATLKIILD